MLKKIIRIDIKIQRVAQIKLNSFFTSNQSRKFYGVDVFFFSVLCIIYINNVTFGT